MTVLELIGELQRLVNDDEANGNLPVAVETERRGHWKEIVAHHVEAGESDCDTIGFSGSRVLIT